MQNIIENLRRNQTRDSTAKMYYSVWKQFNNFLIKLDSLPKFWEDRAILFMAYLIEEKGSQSTTIKSYLSAIKRIHIDDNYPWCNNQTMVCSLTWACRKLNDKACMRQPIQCSLLEILLFELERIFATQPYLKALYKTVLALEYYSLMRIELMQSQHVIKVKDMHLALNKEKLLLVLYTSKTHGKESYSQKIKITSNRTERS